MRRSSSRTGAGPGRPRSPLRSDDERAEEVASCRLRRRRALQHGVGNVEHRRSSVAVSLRRDAVDELSVRVRVPGDDRGTLRDSLSGNRPASGARLADRSRGTRGKNAGAARDALADPQRRMASVCLRAVCDERLDMVDSVRRVLAWRLASVPVMKSFLIGATLPAVLVALVTARPQNLAPASGGSIV